MEQTALVEMTARVTPINMAEAIIDPFWDGMLSGLPAWEITPGTSHGLHVSQNWCWVTFGWAREPADGQPALRMRRTYALSCAGYDTLLVSVMAPEGAVFRMIAETDTGTHIFEAPPASLKKLEHALPLSGATRLEALTLEIHAGADGVAAGWLNWVGLQSSDLLPRYLAQHERFDAGWDTYLLPDTFTPSFTPSHGLLVNGEELEALRARYANALAAPETMPLLQIAEKARRGTPPEAMIGDFVNFWWDTRYCRERDHERTLLSPGPYGYGVYAALAGVLTRDAELLRLAARYAMAITMCEHWDDGMICRFPGSTFDHRCFVQSLCTQEVALILDLAGEYFTYAGRSLCQRRLADEGLAAITYNTWCYEYIFNCNQLAWFSPGRMLGNLLLEHDWPRVAAHTEIAYADVLENLARTVLPDGGYVEGPTYYRCVGRDAGLALYYYARARGNAFRDVVPESILRGAEFAAVLASTDATRDVISICDSSPRIESEALAVMAALLPKSQWVAMYRKAIGRIGGTPDSPLALLIDAEIAAQAAPAPAFASLPDMGIMASTRTLDGETVKLFIMGNKAGAGHTHEDKGSFVLEFAGDTFALDSGTGDYSSPMAGLLQHCGRHNMLVPTGTAERAAPQCPLLVDVKPQGSGDAVRFSAHIDATPGWEAYYRRWERRWESPSPDVLVLRDEWELCRGDGVECYWQTQCVVQVEGQVVTLYGTRGTVTITALDACTIRVEELPLHSGQSVRRIAFIYPQTQGEATLHVRLQVNAG